MKTKTLQILACIVGCLYSILFIVQDKKPINLNTVKIWSLTQSERDTWKTFEENGGSFPAEIWDTNGELFEKLDNNTDWNQNERMLNNGTLIWSTYFSNPEKSIHTFPFLQSQSSIGKNEIFVGKIRIRNPKSTLVIQKQEHSISIVNEGQSIELLFDGIQEPFIVPSGMNVLINERFISERTGILFYSKLKKLLRLRPNTTEPELLALAQPTQKRIQERRNLVSEFIQQSKEGIFYQTISQNIESIQSLQKNAVGLSQSEKNEDAFFKSIKPFFVFLNALQEGDFETAQTQKSMFESTENQLILKDALNNLPKYKDMWETYQHIYKFWRASLNPSNELYMFFYSDENISTLWNTAEVFIFEKQWNEAKESIINIKKMIETNPQLKKTIPTQTYTRIRRLLSENLQLHTQLQNEDTFETHKILIETELDTENHLEKRQELILENGKDIMVFIEKSIAARMHTIPLSTLMQSYRILNIDSIEADLKITIFTQTERDIIQIIKKIGDGNINTESIQRIKEQEEEQKNYTIGGERIIPQIETVPKHIGGINNTDDLFTFLEKNGWETNTMQIKEIDGANPSVEFSQAKKGTISLSGQFYYKSQVFTNIKEDNTLIHIRGAQTIQPLILEKFWNNQTNTSSTEPSSINIRIPQETQQALQVKNNIIQLFNAYGLRINKSHIEITNWEYTQFKIQDVIHRESRIHFLFNKESEQLSDITILLNRAQKQSNQNYSITEGLEFINQSISDSQTQ